jgi:hypothetical protein
MTQELIAAPAPETNSDPLALADDLLEREVRDFMTTGCLSLAGTTRLLVRRRPHQPAEGVVTDFDLAIAARR